MVLPRSFDMDKVVVFKTSDGQAREAAAKLAEARKSQADPAVVLQLSQEFFAGHINDQTARLTLAEATGVFPSAKTSKSSVVSQLVGKGCTPVRPQVLRTWAQRIRVDPSITSSPVKETTAAPKPIPKKSTIPSSSLLSSSSKAPVSGAGSKATVPQQQAPAGVPATTSAVASTTSSAIASTTTAPATPGASPAASSSTAPNAPPSTTGSSSSSAHADAGGAAVKPNIQFTLTPDIMAQLFDKIDRSRSSEPSSLSKKPKRERGTPIVENERRCRKLVDESEFVDPALLGAEYVRKLQNATPGAARESHYLLTESGFKEKSISLPKALADDPTGIRQGCDALLCLVATSSVAAVRDTLVDRLQFNQKVWAMKYSTQSIAMYVRAFMYTYKHSKTWMQDMKTDMFLFSEHLKVAPPPSRDESRRHENRNGSKPVPKRKRVLDQVCHSRCIQARGACTYKNCRFSHVCPSCENGATHSAADCPSFNKTKADAAMAAGRA